MYTRIVRETKMEIPVYVSNLSAMPEDLDKEISPEQVADFIAYLKTSTEPSKEEMVGSRP